MRIGSLLKLLLLITILSAISTVVFFAFRINRIDTRIHQFVTSPHWYNRLDLFRNDPIPQGAIVFLGNGLIEHFNLHVFASDNIYNRGIQGDYIANISNRLDDILQSKPSKIFILAGINDLREKMPLFMICYHMKHMILKIHSQSPQTKIYIHSLFPVSVYENAYDPDQRMNKKIIRLNRKLKKLCRDNHAFFIHIYPRLVKDEQLDATLAGDFHALNQTGYKLWTEAIRPFVEN